MVIDIIKAEGTELIRQQNPSAMQKVYREKSKQEVNVDQARTDVEVPITKNTGKTKKPKLLAITDTIEEQSSEIDEIITNLEYHFNRSLKDKERSKIKAIVIKEVNKNKTLNSNDVTKKIIRAIKKLKKKKI